MTESITGLMRNSLHIAHSAAVKSNLLPSSAVIALRR
jgi:hypothetical protein